MTLSCAEYHWKDIERLIKERMQMGGLDPDLFDTNRVKFINQYTLVVQEYFQERVKLWLNTVGKKLFKIKHYWLRFEFAPSRGQIHAHLIIITDHMKELEQIFKLKDNQKSQAEFIHEWLSKSFHVTARTETPTSQVEEDNIQTTHPSTKYFSNIMDNIKEDKLKCQLLLQNHKCSKYCMRKRKIL